MQTQPIPVILDVDTGYDDALALLLALGSPRLTIRGITCVAGNQRLPQVVQNTLTLLDAVGAPEIPVAAGMATPLLEELREPSPLHGLDGMGDLGLPAPRRAAVGFHAVELLHQLLAAASEPIHLIALAPLTNIALFLRMYPALQAKIAGIMVMGGTFLAAGNSSPTAEFNIRQDPEAAAIVLESGVPIQLYTLDVFRDVQLTRAEIDALMATGTPNEQTPARIAGRILDYVCHYFQRDYGLIGDAGAVAAVIDPAAVTLAPHRITVELSGRVGRGQTVLDRRTPAQQKLLTEWGTAAPQEIEVVTAVDATRSKELFLAALAQSKIT